MPGHDAPTPDSERWEAPGAADLHSPPTPGAAAAPPPVQTVSARGPVERFAPHAAIAAIAALVLSGLSAFGIWDPWEIELADKARRLADGESMRVPHIGPWLVSRGFRWFGVDEWSGRLPIALSGVLAVALTYPLVARFAGRRAGLYAVLIAGTSPLFLFNARTMLGEAPLFALQSGLVLCASHALFGGRSAPTEAVPRGAGWRVVALAAALVLAAAATISRGALLGALPPLGAAALLAAFDGKLQARRSDPLGFGAAIALCAAALAALAIVASAVLADRAGFNVWLGGTPQGGQPPTFEVVIERVFHAFAPWSALLPLALARLAFSSSGNAPAGDGRGDDDADQERRLGTLCLLWLALSYAVLTLFLSRYGDRAATYPITALAAAVALFLRDVERSRASQWPAAIAGGLLAALIIRDYALYPSGPVHGMPLSDFTVPDVFNPRRTWSAVLGVFAGTVVLGFGAYATGGVQRLQLTAPYRLIAAQWRRGRAFKVWLIVLAAALVTLELFGVLAWFAPKAAHLTTQGIKWGRRLMLVPVALPLAVAALQLIVHAYAKLREQRNVPILIAGAAVGVYTAFGFMPALSAHFSPREVYETYNELAAKGEPLVEYKVSARAAAYYAKGAAVEADNMSQLLEQLLAEKRTWAIFPSDELAPIDRMFRVKTGRHLFVADARSAKVTLATNQPLAGRKDQSFLTEFVKREAPVIQHPVKASFEDKIELLGYDLKLPHGDHVAAGESFELTWYFKALRQVPGAYRIFVHIDANAMRIGGDHDPVEGRYPVRMWDPGDVIVDRQRIEVPPNYTPGAYTIFMGFYSGETRLAVKEGPRDEVNRVRAGVLRIR
jgi:4-amino-4-deoxy-L-arabinose transferase-like glycosyltransferase